MPAPKVSIIIPVFNQEKYLQECYSSINSQTLKEVEIIFINDGSFDLSLQILQNLSNKDTRIVILESNNQGAGAARNLGIQIAKGEYILFLDSDDFYPNIHVIEKLYHAVKENEIVIAAGGLVLYEKPNLISKKKAQDKMSFPSDGIISIQDYQYCYGFTRFIYDRKFLLSNNIFFKPLKRFEDPPFLIQALIASQKFYAITHECYGYRVGHHNTLWTQPVVNDYLTGLNYVLKASTENSLQHLEKILLKKYSLPIVMLYLRDKNSEIFNTLYEASKLLGQGSLDKIKIEPLEKFLKTNIIIWQLIRFKILLFYLRSKIKFKLKSLFLK